MKKLKEERENEDWALLRALAHTRDRWTAREPSEYAAQDADTVPVPALALQPRRAERYPELPPPPLLPCPCEPCSESRAHKRTADRTVLVLAGLWLLFASGLGRCEPTKAQADAGANADIHAIALELREIRRVLERGCK